MAATTLLPIFVCALGIWMLSGCSSEARHSTYNTVRATRQTFAPTVTALGIVKPQVGAEVRLGARIPGKVEHLRANVGDFVEQGQVIAELEKDELEANVDKQQAELSEAMATLAARQILGPIEIAKAEADSSRFRAAYELKAVEYERQAALFEKNLISSQDFDQAREAFLIAEAESEASTKTLELARAELVEDLKQLGAEVEIAEAALKISEVELSYATLRAPISGIIASVSTQEGETVAVGLSAPTFVTIIDLNSLQVETYVDEVDIGKIETRQKAIFAVEAFPATDIEGEVVGIYPKAILRENVVFYNVVVKSLDIPPVVLRPEMTANVTILLESREDILVVPASSVRRTGGTNLVYLIEEGKPVAREVQIGLREGRLLEITAGLGEGDEILENQGDIQGEEL